jgi:hypothetical protein
MFPVEAIERTIGNFMTIADAIGPSFRPSSKVRSHVHPGAVSRCVCVMDGDFVSLSGPNRQRLP